MMKYNIIVQSSAEHDLHSIKNHIAGYQHEPKTALDVVEAIQKEIESLESMPERYQLAADEEFAQMGVRITSAGKYLIFYTVDKANKTVHILNVQHGRREWRNILFKSDS